MFDIVINGISSVVLHSFVYVLVARKKPQVIHYKWCLNVQQVTVLIYRFIHLVRYPADAPGNRDINDCVC